jgi:hypothetical protein
MQARGRSTTCVRGRFAGGTQASTRCAHSVVRWAAYASGPWPILGYRPPAFTRTMASDLAVVWVVRTCLSNPSVAQAHPPAFPVPCRGLGKASVVRSKLDLAMIDDSAEPFHARGDRGNVFGA